jgi:hypothetical protein
MLPKELTSMSADIDKKHPEFLYDLPQTAYG